MTARGEKLVVIEVTEELEVFVALHESLDLRIIGV